MIHPEIVNGQDDLCNASYKILDLFHKDNKQEVIDLIGDLLEVGEAEYGINWAEIFVDNEDIANEFWNLWCCKKNLLNFKF